MAITKTNTTPLEETEQAQFVLWLERQGLKFTAIPNSTYTKSWSQKRKNYNTGLRAGFPDMVVLIPPTASRDGLGYFLCIEMKRLAGSSTSQDQKDWLANINSLGCLQVQSYICKGYEEAKKTIDHYCLTSGSDTIF